jgi:serine/threonine protein kinase
MGNDETPYENESQPAGAEVAWEIGDKVFGDRVVVQKLKGGSSAVYILGLSSSVQKNSDGWVHHGFNRSSNPTFCAAKILHSRFRSSDKIRKEFIDECIRWSALGRLPHVVQGYGVRYSGNVPVLFMECIAGRTLQAISQSSALSFSPKDIITWCCDFWRGMKAAIERGLEFHGDITPSNLLVDAALRLYITDVGQARMRGEKVSAAVRGTPQYRAPEVNSSNPKACDWRADQYSFALVILRLTTRTHAAFIDPDHLLTQLTNTPFKFLLQFLSVCLSQNPAERYGTPDEIERNVNQLFQQISGNHYQAAERPEYYSELLGIAKIQYESGLPEAALATLSGHPASLNVHTLRSCCLSALGRPEDAISELDGLPVEEVGYYLAFEHAKLGHFELAYELVGKALATKPEDTWLLLKLRVAVLAQLARKEKGARRQNWATMLIEAAQEALDRSPEALEVWVNKALGHYMLSELDKAEACIQRVVENDPQYDAGHHLRGLIFFARKQFDEAARSFQEELKWVVSPDNRYASLNNVAISHLQLNQFEKAANTFEEARGLRAKHDVRSNWYYAQALIGADRKLEEALELLESVADELPRQVRILTDIGYACLGLSKLREARHNFDAALRIDDASIPAIIGRVRTAWAEWDKHGVVRHEVPTIDQLIERLRGRTPHYDALCIGNFTYFSKGVGRPHGTFDDPTHLENLEKVLAQVFEREAGDQMPVT